VGQERGPGAAGALIQFWTVLLTCQDENNYVS